MRILYAVTIPRTALNLLRGQLGWLCRRGHEVHLACASGPELAELCVREGITVHELSLVREPALSADIRALPAAVRLVRRLRPDVVFAATAKAGLMLMLAARLCRVQRRVRAVWGLRHETLTGFKRWLVRSAEKLSCRCAHEVVTLSPSLAKQVIAEQVAPAWKVTVPGPGTCNGVDAGRFAPDTASVRAGQRVRRELNLPAAAVVVGFVGRLVRDKGIEELVAAFHRLRPRFDGLRLLLVGGFEEGDPLPLAVRETIIRDPGIAFAGRVEDSMPYYHAMDIFCLPSRREGFPNAPLEAAAAGLPVITTDATGARDAIEGGVTGLLVPAGETNALADALARLVEFPELRRQMGEAGRRRVCGRYRPERVWQAIEAVLVSGRTVAVRPVRPNLYPVLKRVMDIVLVAIGGLILSPFLALLATAQLLVHGRPILFRQARVGRDERPFMMLKFRTMRNGPGDDAARLTRFGRFLRRFSLDELPQLVNILLGEMSLVGPRPTHLDYVSRMTREQRRRHLVPQGITCIAQVSGRNALSWERKFELDVEYVERCSLRLDVALLLRTFGTVLSGRGVTAPGAATGRRFAGSGAVG